jgi:penicillin amidase
MTRTEDRLIRRGWFVPLAAVVALGLVAVLVIGLVRVRVARSRLPERGLLIERVEGCPAEIVIRLDTHGIPHIRTDDEEALWFAQGWVHARDRFFQMELARRLAGGRLAEVFGSPALASDRRMRTWRLAASARRQAALLGGEPRAVLEAYAAGVNAALERWGRWIAPEIWMLGVEPEPWRPESSLEVALLLQLETSWAMGEEFRRAEELTRLGRDRAADLWGWSPEEARAWLPPTEIRVSPRDPEEAIRPPLSGVGSNSWALARSKTATGRALLAADPHFGVQLPLPFALIHLSGPGIHAAGASVPGMPGVLIGHNEHVAWSFTMAMLDDQDLFSLTLDEDGTSELVDGNWVPLRTVTEEIRVRWRDDPVVLKIRMSEHGPLIRDTTSQHLALAWTGFSGEGIVRAVLDLDRSVSASDAASAWEGVVGPSMSLVAADTGGHIVHQVVGQVPDRGRGFGRLPSPGADSRWGWRGFLPMVLNPGSADPADGVLVAANQDLYAEGDASMDRRLPGDFASPWRARRIRRALLARDDWDVASTLNLQRDVVSDRAIAMLRLLREELSDHGGPTAEALLGWDGRMSPDEVAPHLFSRLLLDLGIAAGADELSSAGNAAGGLSAEQLLRLVAGGLDESWWDDVTTEPEESRQEIVRRGLDGLDRRPVSEPWGQVHTTTFRHPLADIPVAGRLVARSWSRGPLPTPGDNVTVYATYWSRRHPFEVAAMPALRMVADVGNWDRTLVCLPLGQSGRPWSSHYADQLSTWQRGGAVALAFSDAAVDADAEARLVLRPTK